MARGKVMASYKDMFIVGERDVAFIAKQLNNFGLKDKIVNIKIVENSNLAVEKFLKGYLLNNNIEVFKIHELDVLHLDAFKHNNTFEKIKSDCDLLDKYGAGVKYDPTLEIEELKAEKAVKSLENIYNFPEIKKIRDDLRNSDINYPQEEYNLTDIINNYNNKYKTTEQLKK